MHPTFILEGFSILAKGYKLKIMIYLVIESQIPHRSYKILLVETNSVMRKGLASAYTRITTRIMDAKPLHRINYNST
jgi:hypothetical protein